MTTTRRESTRTQQGSKTMRQGMKTILRESTTSRLETKRLATEAYNHMTHRSIIHCPSPICIVPQALSHDASQTSSRRFADLFATRRRRPRLPSQIVFLPVADVYSKRRKRFRGLSQTSSESVTVVPRTCHGQETTLRPPPSMYDVHRRKQGPIRFEESN